MRILVLSEGYPSNENIYTMAYVHNRNIEYLKKGIDVDVLSFSANENYMFEQISVYKNIERIKDYDYILSHAPNIRNHLKFLYRNYKKDIPIVFFFHGHEIMNVSKYYPKDFWYKQTSLLKQMVQKIYDPIKLKILKNFILKLVKINKVSLVFVSEWMKYMAFDSLSINKREEELIESSSYIINNGVNDVFLNNDYKLDKNTQADFITIRPFDNPKYGIDIVYNLAKNNPSYTFHVYGKGDYFKHVEKLDNLDVFEYFIAQKDIPNYLNKYKCAIMPTRLDAQGVMMCEIATYGMPIITSDIKICREMLKGFSNASFISNNLDEKIDISLHINEVTVVKNHKFDIKKLIEKEINLLC